MGYLAPQVLRFCTLQTSATVNETRNRHEILGAFVILIARKLSLLKSAQVLFILTSLLDNTTNEKRYREMPHF